MSICTLSISLAGGVFALVAAAAPASAQGLHQGLPYDLYGGVPNAYGTGFAEPAISGAYIGAPLTRVPRTNEIVPTPWTYGTYGIPTVSGIPRAPVGQPIVYVIDSPAQATHHAARQGRSASKGPRIVSRGADGQGWRTEGGPRPAQGGAARVVTVSVPQR